MLSDVRPGPLSPRLYVPDSQLRGHIQRGQQQELGGRESDGLTRRSHKHCRMSPSIPCRFLLVTNCTYLLAYCLVSGQFIDIAVPRVPSADSMIQSYVNTRFIDSLFGQE